MKGSMKTSEMKRGSTNYSFFRFGGQENLSLKNSLACSELPEDAQKARTQRLGTLRGSSTVEKQRPEFQEMKLGAYAVPDPGRSPHKPKVFRARNLSINSKKRQANTTMTAYKLLENAYLNQAGNPNNLEEQFQYMKQ